MSFFWFNKFNSLPKQPLASIYGLPLITALKDFFGGVICCWAVLRRVLHGPVVLHDRVIYVKERKGLATLRKGAPRR